MNSSIEIRTLDSKCVFWYPFNTIEVADSVYACLLKHNDFFMKAKAVFPEGMQDICFWMYKSPLIVIDCDFVTPVRFDIMVPNLISVDDHYLLGLLLMICQCVGKYGSKIFM